VACLAGVRGIIECAQVAATWSLPQSPCCEEEDPQSPSRGWYSWKVKSSSDASSIQTRPGLCGDCVNARRIASDRGSIFFLCQLAITDDRFKKYPRLPVLSCVGYEPKKESNV